MKKILSLFLITLLLTGLSPAIASPIQEVNTTSLFTDVAEDAWFFPYVQLVHANRIMQGTSDTTFSPNLPFSRGEIAATLFRIYHGRPANEQDERENRFGDISSTAWYAPYVTWAYKEGISTGRNATHFGVRDQISRQEIALMLYRYAHHLTEDDTSSFDTESWQKFTDRGQIIGEEAYLAFRFANNRGIINGVSSTMLAPQNTTTRAEASAVLVRFLYFLGEIDSPTPPPVPPPPQHIQHSMTWQFSIYEEPSFRAQRVATFSPQVISVIEELEDGWAKIATHQGVYWANIRQNRRFIPNTTGLYANREQSLPTTALGSQVVTILEQEGRWLQVDTWLGPMWLNLDFTPPTQELDALLRRFGNRVSIYFYNIETGFTYRHNATRTFASASVTKAPFAMYIFEKADRGETNLNTRIRYPHGGHLSQYEQLRRMLEVSSNAATHGLRDFHGSAGYRRWVGSLGGNPNWVSHGIMGSTLSADETAIFAKAIFNYIESDAPNSDLFKRHLLNNQFPFIVSDYPVASKTGWLRGLLHDMAIVYADSPYILVVLSDGITRGNIREISMAFQRFNNTWF